MQTLPIGIQHFDVLRERGDIYVDKTRHIYDLMNAGAYLFLSRPRRFGKSLLVTTMREIFRGNRALFQGLWIEDKIDWEPRPVIVINFNDVNFKSMDLGDALNIYLDEVADELNMTLQSQDYKSKFRELIVELSSEKKVAILIDEYDKPITDLLGNQDAVNENVSVLKNFYSVLKSSESRHIHFAFLTGVSKYGKIAVFSDLNNLIDMTVDRTTATLLGITQDELESYFGDYIDQLCQRHNMDREAMLAKIKHWYNGYSWDGENRVYVPFSTLVFLQQQTFTNHWYSTATPTFLVDLLREQKIPAYKLERIGGDNTLLDSADVNSVNIYSLLFQTGYLTIKSTRPSHLGQLYILGYPNYEVEMSFQRNLLSDYIHKPIDQLNHDILLDLEQILLDQDIEAFITKLQAVFADIPHQIHLPHEAYYHSLAYLTLSLAGFDIIAERSTNLGRLDAVLELPEVVYIVEFKFDKESADTANSDDTDASEIMSNKPSKALEAIQQIKNKGYDVPYRSSGKEIILLGIVAGQESRNIIDWMQGD